MSSGRVAWRSIDDQAERATNRPPAPSDDDWSWVNPEGAGRFVRRELQVDSESSSIERLRNIVRISDRIFDDLTVLEGSSEARDRGWVTDATSPMIDPFPMLQEIERALFQLHAELRLKRESHVSGQLARLGLAAKGMKLHIGSAGHPLHDWLNIDIANADLNVNVNWGLPIPDESVTHVYCAHLLEHLRYRDQAPVFVRDVLRVLERGGTARFVVPDLRQLALAYATKNRAFFEARRQYYRVGKGFEADGTARLDYVLLFSGAGPQTMTLNHKFGYDFELLSSLLAQAGFSKIEQSSYQSSRVEALRVDDVGYNAGACDHDGNHFSLFVDATK